MTEQQPHPLTDKILEKFDGYDHLQSQWLFGEEDMRAAYDKGGKDRLELIITWLEYELYRYSYSFDGAAEITYDSLFKDLREAMRPQEDN